MASGKSSSWWPSIQNPETAVKAMQFGAYTAALSAILTAGISGAAIYLRHPVLGMDAWALVDATLFAIVAWRVYRQSLPWSIAGLVIFSLERLLAFISNPHLIIGGVIATVIFLPYYVNAVRGGLYLRAARRPDLAPIPKAEVKSVSEVNTSINRPVEIPAAQPSLPTNDEYSEFLSYLKRPDRKFQKARDTVQDEFAAWLKDHRKRAALAGAVKG
jgi:hypothetical protein